MNFRLLIFMNVNLFRFWIYKTVEVGVSKSNTSSEIDIDNQSDTYGGNHYVNQRFSISGDLKWNTVRVNQGATTVETDPQ